MNKREAKKAALAIVAALAWQEAISPTGLSEEFVSADDLNSSATDSQQLRDALYAIGEQLNRQLARYKDGD